MGPGSHVYNNPVFSFVGFWSSSEPYISLHSKHRIYVPRGFIALVTVEGEPLILEQGVHNFDAERFFYKQMADATEPYLVILTLHRLFLPEGQIALVAENGKGRLVETPGVHVFDSPTFEYKGMKPSNSDFLSVGEASRVFVRSGTVARLNIGGVPQQLPGGGRERAQAAR